VHTFRTVERQGWYSLAAVQSGGLVLDWVRRTLRASWEELYAAADVPARDDDPVFLPHLVGERTPHLDAQLRGAWLGLSAQHGREQMLRSALEGVALAIREALAALPGDAAPDDEPVLIAGGGSADARWRQLLADVLGVALVEAPHADASCRGAAMLAARALGRADEIMPNAADQRRGRVTSPAGAANGAAARARRFDAARLAVRDVVGASSITGVENGFPLQDNP